MQMQSGQDLDLERHQPEVRSGSVRTWNYDRKIIVEQDVRI